MAQPTRVDTWPKVAVGGIHRLAEQVVTGEDPADVILSAEAELQVLSRGQPVGRFVLLPKPGNEFSLEQRVVAVALADQVGAVLATSHFETDGRNRRYG